jgi:AcrR family transcriptional regulator
VKSEGQREYRLNKRARRQAQTRSRIVEAVVALHEEVGPARTTIVEIADRARVSRPTVYSHFPDEESLITACSGHWSLANPRPDTDAWRQIDDPGERLRVALGELYAYYAPRERMLANIIRDSTLMPSISLALERTFAPYMEAATEVLATGWDDRKRARGKLLAALGLALDFHTWQSLTRTGGLTDEEAIDLMAALVEAA